MLSVTWRDDATIRQMIRETRQLTDHPFGINLVLHWPPEERLKACLEEGVPVVSLPARRRRRIRCTSKKCCKPQKQRRSIRPSLIVVGRMHHIVPCVTARSHTGEARGSPPGGARQGEGEGIASWANGTPITLYSAELPGPEVTGEVEAMALYAGQSTGLVSRLQSAQDIVKEMADEAIRTFQQCVQILPKDNALDRMSAS